MNQFFLSKTEYLYIFTTDIPGNNYLLNSADHKANQIWEVLLFDLEN